MTEKQIRELTDTENPTMTVCFHGVEIIHACPPPEAGLPPLWMVRMIGHMMVDTDDDADWMDVVPDHRTVAIDVPMTGDMIRSVSAKFKDAADASTICDRNQRSGSTPGPPSLPEFFKFLFGDNNKGDDPWT